MDDMTNNMEQSFENEHPTDDCCSEEVLPINDIEIDFDNMDLKNEIPKFDKDQLNCQKETFSVMQEYAQLAGLMKKSLKGENINYYNALPQTMKDAVNTLTILQNQDNKKPLSKNQMAKQFLKNMIDEYKKENKDFQFDTLEESLQKFRTEQSSKIVDMFFESNDAKQASIEEALKRCQDNPEKLAEVQKISDSLNEAYTLNKFAEFCLSCKIKDFDCKKYKSFLSQFNYKYSNSKNSINDIFRCIDILYCHIPTTYTFKDILMVLIAFCKYTMNMNPDNIIDHIFMYHFIRYITILDFLNPLNQNKDKMDEKSSKIYNEFIRNITKCIDNLRIRNSKIINK